MFGRASEDEPFRKLVVYTSIIGEGYVLPPLAPHPDEQFICLTDQEHLAANGWMVWQVAPFFVGDSVRSARELKMRPHRHFPEFTRSVYVDPSVWIEGRGEELWGLLFQGDEKAHIAMLHHSFRETLADKFDACAQQRLEDADVLHEHRETIRRHEPNRLQEQPLWSGIVARRHLQPEVIEAMQRWFALTCRYSRRDQLSVLTALNSVPGLSTHLAQSDNYRSHVHQWPTAGYARPAPFAELAQERFELGRQRLGAMTEMADALRHERDELLHKRDELLHERDELLHERDWWFRQFHRLRCRRSVRLALRFAERVGPILRRLHVLKAPIDTSTRTRSA